MIPKPRRSGGDQPHHPSSPSGQPSADVVRRILNLGEFLLTHYQAASRPDRAFVVAISGEGVWVAPVDVLDELTPAWPPIGQHLIDSVCGAGHPVEEVYIFGYSPMAHRWAEECRQQADLLPIILVDATIVEVSPHDTGETAGPAADNSDGQDPGAPPSVPSAAASPGSGPAGGPRAGQFPASPAEDIQHRSRRLDLLRRERHRFAANPGRTLTPRALAAVQDALSDPIIEVRALTWGDDGALPLWSAALKASSREDRAIPAALFAFGLYRTHQHGLCAAILALALQESPHDPMVQRIWQLVADGTDPERVVADLKESLGDTE